MHKQVLISLCCVLRVLCTKSHGEFYFSTSCSGKPYSSQFGIENPAQTGNTGHTETYPGENLVYDTHHRSQGVRGSDHHGYQINDHHSNRIKDSNSTAMAFSKVSQSSYKLKASSAIPFISRAHHPLLFSF